MSATGWRAAVQAMAGRLAMVTPDAHKAFGLASAWPGLRVLTGAWAGGPPAPLRSAFEGVGAELCAVPTASPQRTTRALLESPEAARCLARWGRPAVVVFRPEADTQRRLRGLGCRLVAAAPGAARPLENKRAFRALCRRAGLPVVETVEIEWPPDDANRAAWAPFKGRPVVVQTPRGQAGKRTWRWDVGAGVPTLPNHLNGRPALLAPLIDGPTWTVNAVVGPGGVRVGTPMRQMMGDTRLTGLPLSSSGVALSPPGSELVGSELAGLAVAVGELAAREGFTGFFGIDAVGCPGSLTLIEMNARLTATVTVATLAELADGRRPLLIDHVFHCLGEPLAEAGGGGSGHLSGGHLLVRRAPGFHATVPKPGTYRMESGGRVSVSAAVDWPGAGEVVVWPAGPAWGTPREDRARLLFSSPMMDAEGRLTPLVEDVITSVVEPDAASPGPSQDISWRE